MGRVAKNVESIKKGKCSCFVIDENKPVSPENLLCHTGGVLGYLSDEQEKKFCFGGEFKDTGMKLGEFNSALKANVIEGATIKHPIEETPEGYERHLERMKYDVATTWQNCMGKENRKDFWNCMDEQTDIALELYSKTNSELEKELRELGLKTSGTKQQKVSRLRGARWEPE